MKVLQINSSVNTGSTGRIAENIGHLAKQRGYESVIAFGRKGRVSQSKLIKIGNSLNVVSHGIKSRLLDRHGFGSNMATTRFVKQVKELQPDIIHLHNIHGYYLNIDILFKFLSEYNVPIIWTFHDCWPITGHCSFFDRFDCEKWKTECHTCPNLKGYPISWFLDNSRTNYHDKKFLFNQPEKLTLVAPCKWMKNNLNDSFLRKYSVNVIYNGVDLSVFRPRENSNELCRRYGLEKKKIILGVANVWDLRKGLNDFISMAERIPKNFQIVLVGLSKKQLESLPRGILGLTRTESIDELAELYSLADVFVNPTYVDNFPTTNLEALACGTPVITYDTGGSPEAIDSNTGRKVPKGNINALMKAIIQITETEKSRIQLLCQTRAEENFNQDQTFKKYLDLYADCYQKSNKHIIVK